MNFDQWIDIRAYSEPLFFGDTCSSAMVRMTSNDNVLLFWIIWVAQKEFEAALEVNRVRTQYYDLELEVSFGLQIIFVLPFEGHTLDVIE